MAKITFILIVGCLSFANFSFGQDSIHFIKITDNSFWHLLKKGNKPALIYFTGTGCSLCIKMEKNVFNKENVYTFFNNNFINLESYSDSKKPNSIIETLRKEYGIVSNPSFVFISPDGEVIHKGKYSNETQFAQLGKQALSDSNYASWTAEFKKGIYHPPTVAAYLATETGPDIYLEENYVCKAQEILDKYFDSINEVDYMSSFNWNIIRKHVYNPHSKVFKYLESHQNEFVTKYGQREVDKKIFAVYRHYSTGAADTKRYKDAVAEVETSTVPQAKKLVRIRQMRESASRIINENKSWNNFISTNHQFIVKNSHLVDCYQVLDWVENICTNHTKELITIKKANEWMKYIAESENQDYFFYETYAKTWYLLKNKVQAVKHLQKAIQLAKKSNEDVSDIAALEKKLIAYKN
jgi:thioredoxin-related protein